MAEKQSGFPEHYKEQFKGWANELEQSGWGEKFARAKKEGITKELIIEYQLDYLKELVTGWNPEDVKDIKDVMKYVNEMMETYGTEERVRTCFRELCTPGMHAYITNL